MSTIVVMPGGFHPFHAGHASLYQSALKAFPGAEVYVAATNDTKTRPFPFAIKEKLAKVAGVKPGHFVQVKSPFQAKEITQHYDPEQDVLIFVRSEKDKNEQPKPGGVKKDGTPSYFQPWTGKNVRPFGKQAYIAYLPTVEFGPGITSATEIRNAWPKLDDRRKTAMVMSLYPVTQKNPKLAANVVKMLDLGMGNELDEAISRRGFLKGVGAAAIAGAASGAKAGEFKSIDDLNKDPESLEKVWKPRMAELQARCANILKSFANVAPPGNDAAEIIQNTKLNMNLGTMKFTPGQIVTSYRRDANTGKDVGLPTGLINLETTVMWDAPDDILAFVLGHELGHIIFRHGHPSKAAERTIEQRRIEELQADNMGAYLARQLGYNKAGFFKFLTGKRAEYITNMNSNDAHPSPSIRAKSMNQGLGKKIDFELSNNSVKYIDSMAQQFQNGLAETIKRVEPISKSVPIQQTLIQPKQHIHSPLEKKTPAVINHIKPKEVREGEVVQFKQPSKTLTWQQVPRDILLLANDWFWASEDNSGLDATIDPDGYGNGTANDVKYLTAKLQQKGWTIDFNDEYDGPGEFNLRLTNKRGQTVLLPIEDAQDFSGWAEGTSSLNEGPFVQRITNPKKVSIYLKIGKGSRLVATDIPYEILDKYVAKVIQKYPQFKPTDFSFKATDKINEFALPGGDDREPDEEEILRKLAAQWWLGTEQQMAKAQRTLEAMGWEIGQDESGDDDAGVFVIRAGDENGNSYIAFPHSELSLDEGLGIPYPGTYEQENSMTKTKGGQMRTLAIANESNLTESADYLEEK